jgi:hypothetical protein
MGLANPPAHACVLRLQEGQQIGVDRGILVVTTLAAVNFFCRNLRKDG